jgi:hypothetical protein
MDERFRCRQLISLISIITMARSSNALPYRRAKASRSPLQRPVAPAKGLPFLSALSFRASGAVLIRFACYPSDLARRFRPFVDLLLTCRGQRKKPPGREAIKLLM